MHLGTHIHKNTYSQKSASESAQTKRVSILL